jgi:hypothetical protein
MRNDYNKEKGEELSRSLRKQDRQYACNVMVSGIRANSFTVEKH